MQLVNQFRETGKAEIEKLFKSSISPQTQIFKISMCEYLM